MIAAPANLVLANTNPAAISGVVLSEPGSQSGETFTIRLADTHGQLSATGAGVTGSGSKALKITGSVAQVNADLATLSDNDLSAGSDNIVLTAADSLGQSASPVTIAVSNSGTIGAGSPVTVAAGSTATYLIIGDGGVEQVAGTANVTEILSGGTEDVIGGTTNGTVVEDGGKQRVAGIANRTKISDGAAETVSAGGTAAGSFIRQGGTLNVLAGATAANTVIEGGGTEIVSNGATITGSTIFEGSHGVLSIAGTTLPTATIIGFDANNAAGDQIVLTGFTYSAAQDSVNLGPDNVLTLNLNDAIEKLAFDPLQNYAGHFFFLTTNAANQVVILDPLGTQMRQMNFLAATASISSAAEGFSNSHSDLFAGIAPPQPIAGPILPPLHADFVVPEPNIFGAIPSDTASSASISALLAGAHSHAV